MPQGKCRNPDCTVATTGTCLESHTNVEECPNYYIEALVDRATEGIEKLVVPQPILDQGPIPLVPQQIIRKFYTGNELGGLDVLPIMQRRYTHIIGILGSTGVGKTCLLASLYLLASQGSLLPDLFFAGSFTLQGFEERARGLRSWGEGGPAEQLVEHTRLQDPRRPALMHLCLKENVPNGKWIDLLFTDLPGEWTDDMIDNQSLAARFNFLKRADGIVYVVDGPVINEVDQQHIEVYKAKIAIDRLVESVLPDLNVPLVIAVSKCDKLKMQCPKAVQEIASYADRRGLSTKVIQTVAFSRVPNEIPSGIGIIDTFRSAIKLVNKSRQNSSGWVPSERSFWSFSES